MINNFVLNILVELDEGFVFNILEERFMLLNYKCNFEKTPDLIR